MNLDSLVSSLPKIGPSYSNKLKKLNIVTIGDLLHHAPSRYLDFRKNVAIRNIHPGEIVTVTGTVEFIRNQFSKRGIKIQIAEISDATGHVNVVWFNQPYLIMSIKKGQEISVAGEVSWFGKKLALISPEYEIKSTKTHTGRLIPVYPTTSGVGSKWLRTKIKTAYELTADSIKEYFPKKILTKYNLDAYPESIRKIHFPESFDEIEIARKRLAVNELFFLQLTSLHKKLKWEENAIVKTILPNDKEVNKFIKDLPFVLTKPQKKSVDEILADMTSTIPMNRLLEGDVGSGKTVVAAMAALSIAKNSHQVAFMAPTEILAKQHFKTISDLFEKFKIRIDLITSNKTAKVLGRSDIIIGTHALLYKKSLFDNVTLVVIDEQHKFGVKQRSYLIKSVKSKTFAPHVLTMTATPIPRSIALTVYGDLDLSVIDELPKGRTETKTYLVPVNEEYRKLKSIFEGFKVGLLHGKMKSADKEKNINRFYQGKTDILVATPVVEVGVDVPNANIMIIETAERFGLAQLHQLRGRIGRGTKKSYCLLFTETMGKDTRYRMAALTHENSGFKLAEIDMKLRGPGEIFGIKQHGFPELKIASWSDIVLIKIAKEIAEAAIDNPKLFPRIINAKTSENIVPN